MGKHGKEDSAHLANIGIIRTDETQTIKEIQSTIESVKVIDASIAKYPIPPATVTK